MWVRHDESWLCLLASNDHERGKCHAVRAGNCVLLLFLVMRCWLAAERSSPASAVWQEAWQQQSDEWQLTGVCTLMMCRRALASGWHVMWAQRQQPQALKFQTNAHLSGFSGRLCWIIDIREGMWEIFHVITKIHTKHLIYAAIKQSLFLKNIFHPLSTPT